jgi:hypothetical protein
MKAVWMQGILADFLAAEPLCPQGSSPHAQTKRARNWLLDSSGPVLTSLYYARVNSLRRHPSFHASLESDCIQRQARLEFRQTGGLFVTDVLAGSGCRWPRHRVSIVPHGNLGRVVNGERGVALKQLQQPTKAFSWPPPSSLPPENPRRSFPGNIASRLVAPEHQSRCFQCLLDYRELAPVGLEIENLPRFSFLPGQVLRDLPFELLLGGVRELCATRLHYRTSDRPFSPPSLIPSPWSSPPAAVPRCESEAVARGSPSGRRPCAWTPGTSSPGIRRTNARLPRPVAPRRSR